MFAAIAVVTTLLVVVQSNPVYSVLLLIGSFIGLAGLYVLLDAPFVAVIQIIVYAGAIMVLFLFVVMLLNVPHEAAVDVAACSNRARRGCLEGSWRSHWRWSSHGRSADRECWRRPRRPASADRSRFRQIGERLFQQYAFAFEATSILILVAMVGAVILAGRHLFERTRRWLS